MPKRDRRLLLALGIAVLSIVPYLNGLRNGFTFDDVPIVAENARLRSASGIGSIWATDWWGGARPMSRLYRPIAMSSFAVDYAVARRGDTGPPPARLPDASAFAFHAQNVAWHAAASVALFLLVLELFANPALAGIAAALFAVHPVHTEAVNGIVGRAELMAACFGLLAVLAAARAIRGDAAGIRWPAAASLLFLLALLSKEQAVVVPVIVLIGLALGVPRAARDALGTPSVRRLFFALAVALIAYLAVRTAVLGSVTGVTPTPAGAVNVDNPIAGAHGAARLLTPVRVFGEVVRLLVFPRMLSADYSYDQLPLVGSPDVATSLSLLCLFGMAAAAYALRRRQPAVSFAVLFFFAAWALTSNFVVAIGTILGERLLYLPSAGACVAAAAGLVALQRRLGAPWLAPAVAAALVVLGAGRTWARNTDWKDNLSLFAATATTSPRSCKAANAYASEQFARGRAREALPWAERALAIYPRYPDAHGTLMKIDRVLAADERDPVAKDALRDRVRRHARMLIETSASGGDDGTGLADAWNTLGALSLDEGDLAAAETDYRESLKSEPGYLPAVNGLGVVLMRRGLEGAALEQFTRALELDPASPEARQNAAAALRALAAAEADPARAAEFLRRADAYEARVVAGGAAADSSAAANLHGVRGERLLGEKRFDEALSEFREAARLQPDAARAYLGIGSVLASMAEGEREPARRTELVRQAIDSFSTAARLEPQNPMAHLDLGIMYLTQRRDPAKVAEHFRAYLRLAPDAPNRAQLEQTIRQMDAMTARP